MEATKDRKLYNINETAEMLHVSPRTVWNITTPRGELRCCKIGNRVLYSETAISDYIQMMEQPSDN